MLEKGLQQFYLLCMSKWDPESLEQREYGRWSLESRRKALCFHLQTIKGDGMKIMSLVSSF